MYTQVLVVEELPPEGQPFPENLRFDLKLKFGADILNGKEEPEAIACDMAAFANARGGVLLIGAREEPAKALGCYQSFSQADAAKIEAVLKRAREMCSPQPVIDVRVIPRGDGFVVAVNVDAYAAPPIGAPKGGKSGGEQWWAFPVRRGDDTRNLRPEELATIMDPRARRMALQLERVLLSGKHLIAVWGSDGRHTDAQLVSVDVRRSLVRVELMIGVSAGNGPIILNLPLDAVVAVWFDERDGAHVTIRGVIQQVSARYVYRGGT